MLKGLLVGMLLVCGGASGKEGPVILGFSDLTPDSGQMQVYLLSREAFRRLASRSLPEATHALRAAANQLGFAKEELVLRVTTYKKDIPTGAVVHYHRVGIKGRGQSEDILVLPENAIVQPKTVPRSYISSSHSNDDCANKALEPTAQPLRGFASAQLYR